MCTFVTHEGGHVMQVAMHCFVFILHVKNTLQVWSLGFSISFRHLVRMCEESAMSSVSS